MNSLKYIDEDLLVSDYKDSELTVRQILDKHGVCRYTLYRILDEHHVPRRLNQSSKKCDKKYSVSAEKEKVLMGLDAIHNYLLQNEVYELMDCVYDIYKYVDL